MSGRGWLLSNVFTESVHRGWHKGGTELVSIIAYIWSVPQYSRNLTDAIEWESLY